LAEDAAAALGQAPVAQGNSQTSTGAGTLNSTVRTPSEHAAWLVDLDGTLYHALWLKLAMGAELVLGGVDTVRVIRTFRHEHERLRSELIQPIASPYEEQLQRAARRLGRETSELQNIVERWMFCRPAKWLRLFRRAELLTDIEAFRAAGGRTAIVSDYPVVQKLAALGATHLFDALVANGEPGGPGRLKPWPDGYLLAAERLGVAHRQCLVIGDRPDADGEAARRAGMGFRLVR
jgi:FMN phosphatase YigB (HAD superfamily)